MSYQGKKNRYRCDSCGESFVTIDRDDGTTPMATACRNENCRARALSQFYDIDQTLPAAFEWYRASDAEVAKMKPASQYHHRMGGLFLRPIEAVH